MQESTGRLLFLASLVSPAYIVILKINYHVYDFLTFIGPLYEMISLPLIFSSFLVVAFSAGFVVKNGFSIKAEASRALIISSMVCAYVVLSFSGIIEL